jgi:16S rRNA (cytidine1402-2'-O)-methyltransferase
MPLNSHTNEGDDPDHAGRLFVVGTPIGNLEDITLRALAVLAQVDLIAAEDTRNTQRLLSHHNLSASLISYHEHNEDKRTPELIARLTKGEAVALVSDAGTPTVSDPGYKLITTALAEGIAVVPVPGVSAVTAALSVSGLPTDAFVFIGFPAKKKARRSAQLAALSREQRTIVFYESPKRIKGLLGELLAAMGDRQVVVSREMTKTYEEFLRGTISEVLSILGAREQVKGECTLLVAGADGETEIDMDSVRSDLRKLLAGGGAGLGRISRQIADKYGISRQQVYAEGLKIKETEKL